MKLQQHTKAQNLGDIVKFDFLTIKKKQSKSRLILKHFCPYLTRLKYYFKKLSIRWLAGIETDIVEIFC
jgi:hypothetical protein